MQRSLALSLSLALLLSACCAAKSQTAPSSSAAAVPAVAPASAVGSYYAEETHDGRLYVFGTRPTHEAFVTMHHMPYTRTLIGYSADGRTVVFEVDKKDDALAGWLQAEYDRRHGSATR